MTQEAITKEMDGEIQLVLTVTIHCSTSPGMAITISTH
jgi:hypothetical protein